MSSLREGNLPFVHSCLPGPSVNPGGCLVNMGDQIWIHPFVSISPGACRYGGHGTGIRQGPCPRLLTILPNIGSWVGVVGRAVKLGPLYLILLHGQNLLGQPWGGGVGVDRALSCVTRAPIAQLET